MLSAKEKRVPIEKRVGRIPVLVNEDVRVKQRFDFLSEIAIELMRYPYVSVQLEARYEPESSYLDSVMLRVIALLNPDEPLTVNCKPKSRGLGPNKYRPPFDVMDRLETVDGKPAHTLWENHSVCVITFQDGKMVLEFMEPCSSVVPEPGFIFKFNEKNIRKKKVCPIDVPHDELIAYIVKHIKVPLYKATKKTMVINEGPFPEWNEPAEGESEDAIQKWALVEHSRTEFKAFLEWATPFPVIDDKGGMQGYVTVIFTGGVQAIYTRGLIPVAMQSPHRPEIMFKVPFEFRMPREKARTFGVMPNWRTHPDEYVAWLKGGCKTKKGVTFPDHGRVVARLNKRHENHERILLGCSGKLVPRISDLSAGKQIVIKWPKEFESSHIAITQWDNLDEPQFNWLSCEKPPFLHYRSVVYNRRTTPTAAALRAGPIVTEAFLRKIEKRVKETGEVSEGTTTYVKVDFMNYGDTFTVLAFVHPKGIQYSLPIGKKMDIMEPQLGWSLVPPVYLTVCNDERKGASFYLWDIDERDIHVAKSRSKVVTPKITLDKGLPGLYGYNLKRGLHVVSDLFLYSPKGIASTSMDDPVTVDRILSIAKPEFINQMACTGSRQIRPFDEDIHKYLTYVAPPEESVVNMLKEQHKKLKHLTDVAAPEESVVNMLKEQDKRLTEAADCLRVYKKFRAKNPANTGMADDDYGVWEEGMYERSIHPVRMQLNGEMITVIRAKKTTRPYYLMAHTSARYHPYRILGLPMN